MGRIAPRTSSSSKIDNPGIVPKVAPKPMRVVSTGKCPKPRFLPATTCAAAPTNPATFDIEPLVDYLKQHFLASMGESIHDVFFWRMMVQIFIKDPFFSPEGSADEPAIPTALFPALFHSPTIQAQFVLFMTRVLNFLKTYWPHSYALAPIMFSTEPLTDYCLLCRFCFCVLFFLKPIKILFPF